jgi:hypothetical protein
MAATKKFAEEMYRSFGIRYLFLVALETPSETIQTGVLDFNDSIAGGMSYSTGHRNWKMEGFDMDSWNDHNRDYYNAGDSQSKVESRKLPRVHLQLMTNKYGEPVLPNPILVPAKQEGRRWKQSVVRAFLSKHYGMWRWLFLKNGTYILYKELASGTNKSIPWKKFLPHTRRCVSTEYLPEAYLRYLAEPSSMRDNQCHSLLNFWYQRQVAGSSPVFRFRKYLVDDNLVEAKERELAVAESEDEVEDHDREKTMSKPKGKRKQRLVRSAKEKEKARSSDESSDASSSEAQSTQGAFDVTLLNDEDDQLDGLGLTLLNNDSPIAGPSTTIRPSKDSFRTPERPAAQELDAPLDVNSIQPELQVVNSFTNSSPAQRKPSTTIRPPKDSFRTPERPAAEELDEEFRVTPLDINSLQPELQDIFHSMTKSSPAERKMLVTAFQALQVMRGTPSRSGAIAEQAVLIRETNDANEMKRSRSDTVDPISSSPSKKSRFLQPDSRSYEGNSKDSLDLIGTTEEANLAERSRGDPKIKSKGKKKVVIPSSEGPRLTRSQVLSSKMATRASANHPRK